MSKCNKSKQCKYYSDNSYTCNSNGGNYCGEYRKLNVNKPLFKSFLILSIVLILSLSCVGFVSAVGTYPELDPNMVLYYHFNNDSAYGENDTNIYDFSGNGNNGSVTGAIFNSTGGYLGDGAFEFNGTGYVKIDNIPNFIVNTSLTNQFSFSSWVNFEDDGRTNTLFSFGTTSHFIAFFLGSSGYLDMYYYNLTGSQKNAGAGAGGVVSRNEWHYITLVLNGTNLKYYLDNNLYGSVTIQSFNETFGEFRIGSFLSGNFALNGTIDESILWNRSLTSSEISNNYLNYANTWLCSNENGNFTVNMLNGYLQSIIDKENNLELLTPNSFSGIAYYSNGVWNNFNNPDPDINTVTILQNNVSNLVIKLKLSKYNITYSYNCYNHSFDMDANIRKTDGLPVISNNYSDFQLRYLIPFNYTNFLKWDMNVISNTSMNFNIGKYNQNISRTMGAVYGSSNSFYLFNESLSLLVQLKYPFSRDLVSGNVNQFRTLLSTPIPFEYDNELLFFNSTYPEQNVSLSLVLGNTYYQSKLYSFNKTFLNINDTNFSGLWAEVYSTNISDNQLQTMYNNNVRLVQIHSWFPYYGYYPVSGNWIGIEGRNQFNVSNLNNLAERIKSFGMKPFLYVNPIELQYHNATSLFNSSVSINSSGGYNIGFWRDDNTNKQTYVMSLDNTPWYNNISNQLKGVVDTYSSFSGIFLDRVDYKVLDYAHTPRYSTSSLYNQTFDSVIFGLDVFVNNFSSYIHSKEMLLSINLAREVSLIKYADFITCDSSAKEALINYKLESLGKYFYFMPILPLTINDYLNYSIIYGVFPYYGYPYSNWINISKHTFFMINKTANMQINSFNGNNYVKYINIYGINNDYNLTSSENTDWYDMIHHKLVAINTNSYNYTHSASTANLIYYNFTFGKYQYEKNSGIVKTYDLNNNEIDSYVLGELPYYLNNLNDFTINLTQNEFNNGLIIFSNNSGYLCSGDCNINLNSNKSVYALDQFNCSESLQSSTGYPCGREYSPIWINYKSESGGKVNYHIASNISNLINIPFTLNFNSDCDNANKVTIKPSGGTTLTYEGLSATNKCNELKNGITLEIGQSSESNEIEIELGTTSLSRTILKMVIGFICLLVLGFAVVGFFYYVKTNFEEFSLFDFVKYSTVLLIVIILMLGLISYILTQI